MFRQLLNWRSLLALIAILIVSGTIWYSSYLAEKIKREERQKVEEWVEAEKALLNPANTETQLSFKIIQDNTDIPIIETNEKDSIINWVNFDSSRVERGWPQKRHTKNPGSKYLSEKTTGLFPVF